MLNVFLSAAFAYLLGALLYYAIKIRDLRKKYPDESSELRIIHTVWRYEWPSMIISLFVGAIYVFIIPEILQRKVLNYEVILFIRCVSVAVGLASVRLATSAAGGLDAAVINHFKFKKAQEVEEAKEQSTP